jgi:small redox-active disulfide protein 2
MKVQVLGVGCANCDTLAAMTAEAIAELALGCSVEKVQDMTEILTFDILATPALVVDGVVKVSGRVPSMAEIKEMLGGLS